MADRARVLTVDVIETVAWWALDQSGWIERVLAAHTESWAGSGVCASCSGYRSIEWPCVLVTIAGRARQLRREQAVFPRAA